MLTPTARRRRERYNENDKNDKEQSGAETVKIAACSYNPGPYSNASSPRDGAILNEPDRN
jgi:hypothetical protein